VYGNGTISGITSSNIK